MLEVYFGSDRKAVVDAALTAAKKVTSEPVIIDEHSFVSGQFVELIHTTSLFGEVGGYVIDTPSNLTEFGEECSGVLEDMAKSANHFFLIESTILAGPKKKLAKQASKMEEFMADKPERFNIFGLSDALSRKDKKSLWVMVQEAYLVGVRDEEIIGILWWQIKTLRLVAMTDSPTEAGIKDYPYRKAKHALKHFSPDELMRLSHSLLLLYHQGHKGKRDIRLALEKWLLKM